MTKKDLVYNIVAEVGLTKKKAAETVEAVLEGIKGALAKGDKVQLIGFGSFSTKKQVAREGKNPRTGATIKIADKKVSISTKKFPVFKPAKDLFTIVDSKETDDNFINIKIGNQKITITDPFEIKASDADKVNFEDYKKLLDIVENKYKDLIIEGFKKTNARDIILCDREIVADSNILGGLTESVIRKIEKDKGKVCYIIGRGDSIEEMGMSKWNVRPITNEDDAYPTVPIYCGGSEGEDNDIFQEKNKITADFDTGNPFPPDGFLAFNDRFRKSMKESHGRAVGKSYHLGESYRYNLKEVKIGVVDVNKKRKCVKFNVRFVDEEDWQVFRKVNRKREAFVGRELMFKLNFSITLNPKGFLSTLKLN